MHCTSLLAALLLAPGALAHGYLKTIIVGGVSYPAWEPFSDPYITPKPVRYTRSFKDNGPVPVCLSLLFPPPPSSPLIPQTGFYHCGHHLQHRRQRPDPQQHPRPRRLTSVRVPHPPPPLQPPTNRPQKVPMGPMGLVPLRPCHDLHRQVRRQLLHIQRQLG